jgi:predicted ATP-binding protein involved in virulence
MKITKISVSELFGVFNHEIPLNSDGITIVIGENGLGKTVILEATAAFFGENYSFFRDLDFKLITFHFEGDEYWEVSKTQVNDKLTLYIHRFGPKISKSKQEKVAEIELISSRQSEGKRRVEQMRYHQMMLLDREMVLDHKFFDERRYREYLAYQFDEDFLKSRVKEAKPSWLTAASKTISIKLIETQRIITAKERGGEAYISRVSKSAKELSEIISDIDKITSQIATELDSTYPNRLVVKLQQKLVGPKLELNHALAALDGKRKILSSVGLLEGSSNIDFLQLTEGQNDLVSALELYIEDSHKKLAPYDQIAAKIELFKNIVNKRFKHKSLEVDKKAGFVFRSTVKRDARGLLEVIPAMKLSSGEQNELILFYELIFKSSPGDMIFIDEPEVSLHISWQNKFIEDLKEVTSINNVVIVIATHSPDIISENWDLRVELKGVE